MGLFCGEIVRKDNHKIDDRLLLKRACEGCKQSLSILYQKYRKPVCDFLHKVGADGLAEDICQAVFLEILDEKCNYDDSGDVKSYLFGIANKIKNREITAKNKIEPNKNQLKTVGNIIFERYIQPCPTDALNVAGMVKIVQQKAEKLPAKARQAVELVFLDVNPTKKAAEIAQCDFNTFRNRLKYGLKLLQKSIKKDEI